MFYVLNTVPVNLFESFLNYFVEKFYLYDTCVVDHVQYFL